MSEWQGEERRQSRLDHDLLIAIHTDLQTFMKQFEKHLLDDTARFDKSDRKFDKLDKQANSIQRYIWIGLGIVIALEFAARFVK